MPAGPPGPGWPLPPQGICKAGGWLARRHQGQREQSRSQACEWEGHPPVTGLPRCPTQYVCTGEESSQLQEVTVQGPHLRALLPASPRVPVHLVGSVPWHFGTLLDDRLQIPPPQRVGSWPGLWHLCPVVSEQCTITEDISHGDHFV